MAIMSPNAAIATIEQEYDIADDEHRVFHVPDAYRNRILPYQVLLHTSLTQPKIIDEFTIKTDKHGGTSSVFDSAATSRYRSLRDINMIIADWKKWENDGVYIYDLLSTYNPAFANQSREIVLSSLTKYFSLLKSHLKHKGKLAVQLEDGKGKKEKRAAERYNEVVLQVLTTYGFIATDTRTCQQYSYERTDDHTTGTLYIFENQDYALGEHNPEDTTSVAEPWQEIVQSINDAFAREEDARTGAPSRRVKREDSIFS